jgi:hypothetical protein
MAALLARTWLYIKMRPYEGPSNTLVVSLPFLFWPDCITNTSGYDFRKGQGVSTGDRYAQASI